VWSFTADYHTHTRFSHGKGTVEDNVIAAVRRGLETIGIADHGPANWWNVGIRQLSDFDLLISQVETARKRFPKIKILAGAEANVVSYDGDLDIPQEYQERLDQILVGFHTMIIPRTWSDGVRFIRLSLAARLGAAQFQLALKEHTDALVAAVNRYRVAIVTHPGLKVAIDSGRLAKACAKRGTALEINARHGIKSMQFLQIAAQHNVSFVLSSDAHSPEYVGVLEPAATAALNAGIPAKRVLNVRQVR
jgi:putative hydrolase